MKFLDLFNPIQKGDYGLTDEAIYKSIEKGGIFVPIWGGNKTHSIVDRLVSPNAKTVINKPITLFCGEGIIISLDGSAGSMTYKSGERFALNHHAGFFKVREEAEDLILPEFFALFYQKQLRDSSVSEGSKTLTLEQIYSMDFDIPSFEIQEKTIKKIRSLLLKQKSIGCLIGDMESMKGKVLSANYNSFQAQGVPISDVVDYLSGNSGLTEEVMYQHIDSTGSVKQYEVLSSSTIDRTRMGTVPRFELKGKLINVFEGKEGILTIRNGRAGQTFSLDPGRYTLNDHAYILFLKTDCPYQISLKWLRIQYRDQFLEYASSSDNGTWNMTGFFKSVCIDIPNYSHQNKIINEYEKLDTFEKNLSTVQAQIEDIFNKQIV